MIKYLLPCFIILTSGCSSARPVDTQGQSSPADGFYKCDYNKPYRRILGSGSSADSLTEVWGIAEKDLRSLKSNGPESLNDMDIPAYIRKAGTHIKNRFHPERAVFDSFEIHSIKIAKSGPDDEQNRFYFIVITFLYDERGYYQTIPLLTDGRIILSNNE